MRCSRWRPTTRTFAASCCTSSRIRASRPRTRRTTQDPPPTLTGVGLRSLVTIPRTQSIAGDLERLNEHNRLVDAQRDARETLLRRWFTDDVGEEMAAYRARRAAREVDALLAELTRRWLESMLRSVEFDPVDRQVLRRSLEESLLSTLPTGLPSASNPTAGEIAAWGIDSVVRAATVTLDLAQRGHSWAAPGSDARTQLAKARTSAHAVLKELRELRAAPQRQAAAIGSPRRVSSTGRRRCSRCCARTIPECLRARSPLLPRSARPPALCAWATSRPSS